MSTVERRSTSERPTTMVPPLLPLVLLESVRAHDRPREVLEDEDLTASLPRRLGLTGVVQSQIRRYEEAERKGRSVPLDEVRDLFRLILRRPDAEPILRDSGIRLAQRQYRRRTAAMVRLLGFLPGVAAGAVRRATRSLARRTACGARVEVAGWPLELRLRGAITAEVDPGGTACVLYTGAIEELLGLYLRRRPTVEHRRCASRGDDRCIWTWSET
ncbi:MAG TPA: hypothetical protein VF158_02410 [Longimicrobiales bacterium]